MITVIVELTAFVVNKAEIQGKSLNPVRLWKKLWKIVPVWEKPLSLSAPYPMTCLALDVRLGSGIASHLD